MRALKVFGVCLGGALACALVFVVMLRFSLSPSDAAYGIPIAQLFSDPLVFLTAVCGAIVSAVVVFPFAYFAVRDRQLSASALFVFGVVVIEILSVTPFAGWRGLVGCVPALILGLAVCRLSGWRWFAQTKTPHPPEG